MRIMAIAVAIAIGFSVTWLGFIPSVAATQEAAVVGSGGSCQHCTSTVCMDNCSGSTYGHCAPLGDNICLQGTGDPTWGCKGGPAGSFCPTMKCEEKVP